MPGSDGLDGVSLMQERFPHMFVIMATGDGDAVVATEAFKRGVSDYVAKAHINAQSLDRIVERARQKEILRRNLARQREELERFADVLVHDLKSPITSIRGFTAAIELAIRGDTPDPAKILGHCQRVTALGERMVRLLDTLHEYTRSDAAVAFGPVDLNKVFHSVTENLDQVIAKRAAVVSRDNLPTVFGNGSLLTQLLQNLIGNGIKYCEAAPVVQVSASPEGDNLWHIAVRDNGIGIPEEFHKEIFEPFKRLQQASKYEGTGLGLATRMKIVERLGGRIWCDSTQDQGTTFWFTIPAKNPTLSGSGSGPG